ncbi:flagellar hook-associated protein FlgK [Extensimonas sp. H3M7-6]|uniref:flagellar hook-associated protein FlgK n=1 Tax=Extensimonas soli TaxID=3031322 RepID=UPI0023DBD138|nr:flagellar hook-associated protein FlgK [Extensimonas sp. H3M7-6]MDF1482190.1 flagellar hook-associated protein FlgK [Extensimonas sp. H3M7-6]
MSLFNIGVRALQTNQVVLQTTGHNIANVNTPGYSRQTVALQNLPGQFTGSGFIGQGVEVQAIVRNQSDMLTRQATAAAAVSAADSARAQSLQRLQDVFSGGDSGLGAAINDMMNALADVASAPTDLTARTVVLTRMDETAARMRSASDQLDQIAAGVRSDLDTGVKAVNDLASQIARLNEQIVRAQGSGKAPNDLLDQRDQAIRNLNQYVQTTQVPADDGSLGVFVGNQPLVLGNTAATLSVDNAPDFSGSGQLKLFFTPPGGTPQAIDEQVIGGGSLAGQLKFYNGDLEEGSNLLGRMALSLTQTLNAQNRLGLTLDSKTGGDLFQPIALKDAIAGAGNPSGAGIGLAVADPAKLKASAYTVTFTAAAVGTVVRQSDGVALSFDGTTGNTLQDILRGEGLTTTVTGTPQAGDRFLIQPLREAAGKMQALVHTPSQLAAANPVNAAMGTGNTGSLQLASLQALSNPPGASVPFTLTFTGPNTYTRSDDPAVPPALPTTYSYVSGQAITYDSATPPTGWSLTLSGTPKQGDTVTVGDALAAGDYFQRDAGNAKAMLALRDAPMFDGAPLSDGFASAMAQVGTRTQSAQFAAQMSGTIAANLESDRTAISGVNLDEEAAKLIQYQQAYQASAKMIQVAQTVFDSLLQTMG